MRRPQAAAAPCPRRRCPVGRRAAARRRAASAGSPAAAPARRSPAPRRLRPAPRARRASAPGRAPLGPARGPRARPGRVGRGRPRFRSAPCSRSRSSSLAIRRAERLRMLATLSSSRSCTRTWRICSSSRRCSSSSAGLARRLRPGARRRRLRCLASGHRRASMPSRRTRLGHVGAPGLLDRVAVDVGDRAPSSSSRARPLRAVVARAARVEPERVARRRGPLEQPLERQPRRDHLAGGEVDLRAVEPVADRPPEVLLDLALAQRLAEAAVVVVERRLSDAGGDQRGEVEDVVAAGLGVADPHLDGAEEVVRAHAPPQLGRLDDRSVRASRSMNSA